MSEEQEPDEREPAARDEEAVDEDVEYDPAKSTAVFEMLRRDFSATSPALRSVGETLSRLHELNFNVSTFQPPTHVGPVPADRLRVQLPRMEDMPEVQQVRLLRDVAQTQQGLLEIALQQAERQAQSETDNRRQFRTNLFFTVVSAAAAVAAVIIGVIQLGH